jgi:Dihydroorotase and related cyclic amidohydrolases
MHFDLLIRNGTCVTPWGEEAANVGVSGGRIATLSATAADTADQVIDASGLHVLPGLIDSHVHLRDPGDPAVETLSTGTRAAVLGGIATLFDMPNTNPPIVDQERLDWKRGFAEEQSWCDIGLYIAGAKTNIGELAHLEVQHGVCAIKVFAGSSTASLLVEDDEHLEKLMRAGRRRIAFHRSHRTQCPRMPRHVPSRHPSVIRRLRAGRASGLHARNPAR